ncbi:MAG TPA: hypothetical protein VI299_00175 [Polyangiales bacterium]
MADTEQPELTLTRFRALVEAYGGDLERFPRREREAARALLARSDDAQHLLQAARSFDLLLAEARADVSPAALIERLVAIPSQHAQRMPAVRLLPFHSLKQTWLLAAAALLLGVLGGGYVSHDVTSTEGADLSVLTFADDLFEDLTWQEGELQ